MAGIGVVLEWDPDSDLHTVKRFMPNGPAATSGHLQARAPRVSVPMPPLLQPGPKVPISFST